MGSVNWKEWFLVHSRLRPEDARELAEGGRVVGIEIAGGTNREDRVLYFDNLTPYLEPLPPLGFEPRPRRPLTLPEGQTTGTNTGPGVLPFPTREETILPDQGTSAYGTFLKEAGGTYRFCYEGEDGRLVYEYTPSDGHWGDITVLWNEEVRFRPLVEGGIRLVNAEGRVVLPRYQLLQCRRQDETVISQWNITAEGTSGEVTYTFRLWQKSLVIDVACRGGIVAEVVFGRAEGIPNPRLVTVPYLTCDAQRPAVVVAGSVERPLFLMGLVDYYRSNASSLFAVNDRGEGFVQYNGGARYLAKTDGKRNDCFERIFLTVSPRFEEVLPNIPNPRSPWMHVAGERVWRAHGASQRERDLALWKQVVRHGMTKIVVTDHETGWRDGGESFTLRTRAAPGKGGDEGQRWYAQKMHELGLLYGIYNNYTDYAPVNEHWNEDHVTRLPDGNWRRAWPRCYNLKPARAVEFEAKLAPIIQQKFHLTTAYCDVHTAVRPWDYCDYDARVPGAGTFAATFYAYGEIMLHQKATWNGPVYSEGNNHWYYCGLTDGNYAQDQLARLDINPWLVDFDLRKLHPLCCNFGMGNLGMFYPQGRGDLDEQTALDRFLAATLAFGHTGFLVLEGGMANAFRSYYSVQQIHARYAQERVAEIAYHDGSGRLVPTTLALACGAYKRSQVYVRYDNGLELWVNGNRQESWVVPDLAITLPPNGWYVRGEFTDGRLTGFSAVVEDHRADYVDGPEYLYANGRGKITRFPRALCDGQLALLPRADGSFELIPLRCTVMAVDLGGRTAQAVALREDPAEPIGPAEVRLSRGLAHVLPVPGAFSYRLVPQPAPQPLWNSPRDAVVPGETVWIEGEGRLSWQVPADAQPGTLIWFQRAGRWLDFRVVPPLETRPEVQGQSLILKVKSNLSEPCAGTVQVGSWQGRTELLPGQWCQVRVPLEPPSGEGAFPLPVKIRCGATALEQNWTLQASRQYLSLVPFPEVARTLQAFRGQKETAIQPESGSIVHHRQARCGGVEKPALFMHPPYKGGVGQVAAVLEPVCLPPDPAAVLRCYVGKADGSDPGDGILFRVGALLPDGTFRPIGEKHVREHAWSAWELDLSDFRGKEIQLKLIADVGPADNSVGDWACWADLRLETSEPVWVYAVQAETRPENR
jgi:hypothetical protein